MFFWREASLRSAIISEIRIANKMLNYPRRVKNSAKLFQNNVNFFPVIGHKLPTTSLKTSFWLFLANCFYRIFAVDFSFEVFKIFPVYLFFFTKFNFLSEIVKACLSQEASGIFYTSVIEFFPNRGARVLEILYLTKSFWRCKKMRIRRAKAALEVSQERVKVTCSI